MATTLEQLLKMWDAKEPPDTVTVYKFYTAAFNVWFWTEKDVHIMRVQNDLAMKTRFLKGEEVDRWFMRFNLSWHHVPSRYEPWSEEAMQNRMLCEQAWEAAKRRRFPKIQRETKRY